MRTQNEDAERNPGLNASATKTSFTLSPKAKLDVNQFLDPEVRQLLGRGFYVKKDPVFNSGSILVFFLPLSLLKHVQRLNDGGDGRDCGK